MVWNETTGLWHMYFHFWNSDHYAWRGTGSTAPGPDGFGHQMTAVATTNNLSSHNWTPLPGDPDVLNPAYEPVLPTDRRPLDKQPVVLPRHSAAPGWDVGSLYARHRRRVRLDKR